jgi:hypothetical protein
MVYVNDLVPTIHLLVSLRPYDMTFDSPTTPPTFTGRCDDYEFLYSRISEAGGTDYESTLFNRPKKPFSRSKAGVWESVLSERKGSAVWLGNML